MLVEFPVASQEAAEATATAPSSRKGRTRCRIGSGVYRVRLSVWLRVGLDSMQEYTAVVSIL